MKCLDCNIEMKVKIGQKYHYTESGLDNVFLTGVNVYYCPKCHVEIPEIPHIKNLHLCIALQIVEKPQSLSGNEIKFLRKNLGMKSKDLAVKLAYEPEAFSRLETSRGRMSETGDRLLRVWFFAKKAQEIEGYTTLLQLMDSFEKIKHGGTYWRIEIPVKSIPRSTDFSEVDKHSVVH